MNLAASNNTTPLALELQNISVHFGGIKAVQEVNLCLKKGEILALIGPNGAGKTTVFNVLTGIYQPTLGRVLSFGRDLKGLRVHQITGLGIARTFQNIRLFKDLSVEDNILIAMDRTESVSLFTSMIRTPKFFTIENRKRQKAQELLEIFKLADTPDTVTAGSLPYGVQRRLEIARSIATGAKILLLDEPAAGMNGQETKTLMDTIHFIRQRFDLSILLIEHDMKLVMGISERVAVLEYGKKIADGTPREIQDDKNVVRAYLGTEG